jgi:hypothetical protein
MGITTLSILTAAMKYEKAQELRMCSCTMHSRATTQTRCEVARLSVPQLLSCVAVSFGLRTEELQYGPQRGKRRNVV